MDLKNQVCTFEQAKALKTLGLQQRSRFYYAVNLLHTELVYISELKFRGNEIYVERQHESYVCEDLCAAFNVAELGVMLPKEIPHNYNSHSNYYICFGYTTLSKNEDLQVPCIWYEDNDLNGELEMMDMMCIGGDTEADARAKMLLYLLGNKNLMVEDVNKRLIQ